MMIVSMVMEEHGGGVGGEIEDSDTFPFPRRQHGFHVRKTITVDGTDVGNTLPVDEIADDLFRVFQHGTGLRYSTSVQPAGS